MIIIYYFAYFVKCCPLAPTGRADCELRAKEPHGGVEPAEHSVDPLNANNQAGCHEVTGEGFKLQKPLDIYCAHTNLDRAQGGTTDTLIKTLGLDQFIVANSGEGFTRYINYETSLQDFVERLKTISPHLRYVNNKGVTELKRIAFCAGSGTEFIQEAFENGADALVSGDLKFHTALDSPIVVFDIGHFESEILVLPVFEQIIGNSVEFVYAKETSPFKY